MQTEMIVVVRRGMRIVEETTVNQNRTPAKDRPTAQTQKQKSKFIHVIHCVRTVNQNQTPAKDLPTAQTQKQKSKFIHVIHCVRTVNQNQTPAKDLPTAQTQEQKSKFILVIVSKKLISVLLMAYFVSSANDTE